jgi:hypothetical protein
MRAQHGEDRPGEKDRQHGGGDEQACRQGDRTAGQSGERYEGLLPVQRLRRVRRRAVPG